jgi:YD repeat-containing protein
LSDPVWDWREFGLPFTKYQSHGGRYLSTRQYRAGSSDPVRSTYVLYERDQSLALGGMAPAQNGNARLKARSTVFHDDGDRWVATELSSFDGLGHYRTETLSGNFDAGNSRTTTKAFNPTRGTYPGDFQMLGSAEAWVLGTYADENTTSDGQTLHTDACFDPQTGFLQRLRTRKNPGATGAGDVVVVFTRTVVDGSRFRIDEQHFGGDTGSAASGSLCNLSLSGNQYWLRHEHQYGSRRSTAYLKAGGSEIPHSVLDLDVDRNTGLPLRSRDVAGLATDFQFDAFGRLTREKPEGDAWVQYEYLAASAAAQPAVNVYRRPNGVLSGTNYLAQNAIVFDDFGRVMDEKQMMPDQSWSTRRTTYNARGWRTSVSELGNVDKTTRFLELGPFGRPGRIRPADGTATEERDITLVYRGTREVERTTLVATIDLAASSANETSAATLETYDRQGRLYQVREPNGALTRYAYDAGHRLSRVCQGPTTAGTTSCTQTRQLTYDPRGFLTSESHPEKGGPSGGGVVSYSSIDPLGNARRVVDGLSDLTYDYDRVGRVTLIRESGTFTNCTTAGPRCIKSFTYPTSNGTNDYRRGKLRRLCDRDKAGLSLVCAAGHQDR